MTSLGDILFAATPDGERVFDDELVDHALPFVLLMVAFPLSEMPERAKSAFVAVLQQCGVSSADAGPVLMAKVGAFYEKSPIDPRLYEAVMAWIRQQLRDHAPQRGENKLTAEKLGLDRPRSLPTAERPAGTTAASPLARFSLGQHLPKK